LRFNRKRVGYKNCFLQQFFIESKDEKYQNILSLTRIFDVNQYKRPFQGGGHRNAAGGKSEVSMEETVSKFEI
jgi:phosphoesterase RecJ-like protein